MGRRFTFEPLRLLSVNSASSALPHALLADEPEVADERMRICARQGDALDNAGRQWQWVIRTQASAWGIEDQIHLRTCEQTRKPARLRVVWRRTSQ